MSKKILAILTVFLAVATIFSLVVFAGKSAIAKAEQNQGQSQGENIMNEEQNQEQEQEQNEEGAICNNQCGDGTCQEVVCLATNCPCAESKNNCPNDCGSKDDSNGQINAREHRSAVANFVQSLLNVADRQEGGIGEQVRVIAQQQNNAEATTTQAMEKIQTRSKIKTFLFGSDYKNLGALRSEMVHTRNRLDRLNRLLPTVQNASDTVEIQNQIQVLEQEQTKINNFIQVQEGKFSLFGWLLKLFNK